MFVSQVADGPPSSHDSPQLRPQMTRGEIESALASGSSPPVFTSSLRRSLRNDRDDSALDQNHLSHRKTDCSQPLSSNEPETKERKNQICFQPRASILDYTELMYQGSDRIRGLVTCFWTIIGAYLVSLLLSHYENN
ncbi:hypothetical protein IWW43_003217, partial [Coemansia sp. RSA 1935]